MHDSTRDAAELAAVLAMLENTTNQTWLVKRRRAAAMLRAMAAELDTVRARAEELETEREKIASATVAIVDTREALGLCAPTEADFPALYALQGRRVALVDLGPA